MKHKHVFGKHHAPAPTEVIKNVRTGQEFARSHAVDPDLWHGKKHGALTAFKEEMRKQPAFETYRVGGPPAILPNQSSR